MIRVDASVAPRRSLIAGAAVAAAVRIGQVGVAGRHRRTRHDRARTVHGRQRIRRRDGTDRFDRDRLDRIGNGVETAPPTIAPTTTESPLADLPDCPTDALDEAIGPVEITFWHA